MERGLVEWPVILSEAKHPATSTDCSGCLAREVWRLVCHVTILVARSSWILRSAQNDIVRLLWVMRHLLLFKHITDAADGMDQFVLEWVVHFRAQPAHNDVNHIRVSFESYVPHVFCNLGARDHFAS